MPLPMVHLAIAVRLAQRAQTPPSPAFLLGSIAPDSIHMRPDAARTDKRTTHLVHADWDDPELQTRVNELMTHHAGSPEADFVNGYAAHILTDQLWWQTVLPAFRASVPADMDEETRQKLYYTETDQTDFHIYHRSAWRPAVWEWLAEAQAIDFAPLLSAAEIDGWRARTLRFFAELQNEPGIIPQYITDITVRDFVAQTSDALLEYVLAGKWQIQL